MLHFILGLYKLFRQRHIRTVSPQNGFGAPKLLEELTKDQFKRLTDRDHSGVCDNLQRQNTDFKKSEKTKMPSPDGGKTPLDAFQGILRTVVVSPVEFIRGKFTKLWFLMSPMSSLQIFWFCHHLSVP